MLVEINRKYERSLTVPLKKRFRPVPSSSFSSAPRPTKKDGEGGPVGEGVIRVPLRPDGTINLSASSFRARKVRIRIRYEHLPKPLRRSLGPLVQSREASGTTFFEGVDNSCPPAVLGHPLFGFEDVKVAAIAAVAAKKDLSISEMGLKEWIVKMCSSQCDLKKWFDKVGLEYVL